MTFKALPFAVTVPKLVLHCDGLFEKEKKQWLIA